MLRSLARISYEISTSNPPVDHVVTRVATLTEAYVDDLLDVLVKDSNMASTSFGKGLLDRAKDTFHDSWPNRLRWLSSGFGLAVSGTSAQQAFDAVIELRNAIVHGRGRLTARQKNDIASMLRLEKKLADVLNVQADGGPLHYLADTSARVVEVAREFVLHIDSCARASYPRIKF
ncbi:hypothetical protein [Dactylosporangium sp. NPDC051541]|uniref:hypothetical protein n=1 Tax=Dactylosporangium sp. NPDC051541 TaxID=3363977 RepID=UPI0037982164